MKRLLLFAAREKDSTQRLRSKTNEITEERTQYKLCGLFKNSVISELTSFFSVAVLLRCVEVFEAQSPRRISVYLRRAAALGVCLSVLVTGCGRKSTAQSNQTPDTGPVPAKVEPDMDSSNFKVEHAEQFSLVTAGE